MIKSVHSYVLALVFVFCTAWKTDRPKGTISDTISTSYGLTHATANRANFSGEWKLNELKSYRIGNFPICIFGEDHVRSKTMKIAEQADFLIVDVVSPGGVLSARQEKLTFDGKEREALVVGSPREESTARLSADGQTMTVSSARFLDDYSEKAVFKVTEIWKLIHDGQSIAISVQVGRNDTSGVYKMQLVYDRR